MKCFACITLLVTAFFLNNAAIADPQIYQVEFIAFSHINAAGLNSENWPLLTQPQFNTSQALSLNPLLTNTQRTDDKIMPYQILPNFNFTLNNIGNKLMSTTGYNVLLHLAWRQPIDDSKAAKWIHLFGGTGFDDQGNVVAQDMDGSAHYNQAQHWQIDGLLKLGRLRYINTRYNFIFTAPAGEIQDLSTTDNFSKIDAPLVYFKLDQSRRMRSDELNYIGHPLYGILINITKVNTPIPEGN